VCAPQVYECAVGVKLNTVVYTEEQSVRISCVQKNSISLHEYIYTNYYAVWTVGVTLGCSLNAAMELKNYLGQKNALGLSSVGKEELKLYSFRITVIDCPGNYK
jgi:hypothetical protein